VQIYAIGLGGPTLQAELDKLTQPTGGAAFVKSLSAIKPAIEQTHNLMKGQRRAVFLLYPPQANNPEGKFDATLEVTTDTGVRHAAPFTFFTKRAYTAPPIFIFDRGYSTLGGLQLHFKCVNPGQLEQVQIQLFKSDSPEPIDEIVRKDALAASEKSPGICIITVPRTKLDLGRSYTMRGFVKQQDQPIGPLFAEDKEPTVVFDPKPPTLNVAGFGAPSPTSSQFIITLTSDVETVVDVSLFQANQSNEAVAVRTQTDVALGRQAKTITFTAGDLPTGLYVAQVAWKDNPAVSARSNAVNYAPESLGEWLARIGNGSTTSRLALIGIAAAAIVGLIVVVLLMRSRASSPIKVVPDELTKDQRMRRIQINTSPPSANQPSAMSSAPPPQSPEPSQVNQQPQQPQQPKFSQPKAEPAASGPPAAYIRVLKPANINFKGRIRKTPFAIGRDNTNDGILPVDGASGVSRKKHISLVFHNGQWHVRDEGTPNGTKLNGSRIAPNQLLPLGAQAVLVLGQVEIEFQIEKQ
jgi:pSer/pThr/pTyr-binding forkhead associated (FHA) protein